jgi:hypothetical protein
MERLSATLLGLLLQSLPDLERCRWPQKKPIHQGSYVESASSYHQGNPPSSPDFLNFGPGQAAEISGREGFVWLYQIDQVVGDSFPFPQSRLSGADVHIPVYLKGVGNDDFTIPPLRKKHRYGSLANRRWTQEDDDTLRIVGLQGQELLDVSEWVPSL